MITERQREEVSRGFLRVSTHCIVAGQRYCPTRAVIARERTNASGGPKVPGSSPGSPTEKVLVRAVVKQWAIRSPASEEAQLLELLLPVLLECCDGC